MVSLEGIYEEREKPLLGIVKSGVMKLGWYCCLFLTRRTFIRKVSEAFFFNLSFQQVC